MKAEDVDPALVEKAARAIYAADPLYRTIGWKATDEVLPWDELPLADIQEMRNNARHALAAVLPDVRYAAKVEAVTEARQVISQYLATAENTTEEPTDG